TDQSAARSVKFPKSDINSRFITRADEFGGIDNLKNSGSTRLPDISVYSGWLPNSAQNKPDVTVTDIGPELGASYAGEGFLINREDPRQILLPAAGAGVFKSINSGQTWLPASLIGPQGFALGALFMREDPGNPSVVFAVTLPVSNSLEPEAW